MPVLIFIDQSEGQIKKASFEAMSYGSAVAQQLGTTAAGLVLGSVKDDLSALGKYGIQKVFHANNAALDHFDAKAFTKVVADAVSTSGSDIVIFSHNVDGKAVAPRLSARLKAGLVAGAIALPETSNGFVVKKSVFSGKAFVNLTIKSAIKIISLNPNSYQVKTGDGAAEVVQITANVDAPKTKVVSVNKVTGEVPLSEAEVVVSGG
ncbi:MAG: electron transfer flavoprotein subunit alpha/FixB family protein, partial [Gemmatimonadaceae bacterium]|nr:electron transfer flavoprotein subunit alpha/FixB family protein [Chitinophagaceae bacterium]